MLQKKYYFLYAFFLLSLYALIRSGREGTLLQIMFAAGGFILFLGLLIHIIRKESKSHR